MIGADDNGDPIPLANTPPDVFVISGNGCDPLEEYGNLQVTRQQWIADDGTVYDAWFVTGGSQYVTVPGDAKCLPTSRGSDYLLAGVADTLNNNGPFNGRATGIAADSDGPSAPAYMPLFKIVK